MFDVYFERFRVESTGQFQNGNRCFVLLGGSAILSAQHVLWDEKRGSIYLHELVLADLSEEGDALNSRKVLIVEANSGADGGGAAEPSGAAGKSRKGRIELRFRQLSKQFAKGSPEYERQQQQIASVYARHPGIADRQSVLGYHQSLHFRVCNRRLLLSPRGPLDDGGPVRVRGNETQYIQNIILDD